ncbi:MAG: hypothetical protein HY914_14685 [Desulfomonile tiedjei]|nr:hypothetical protein [Desulfomonile tiedjei]
MFTEWDKEFDVVCGSAITCEDCDPLADSGVWDLLHGTRQDVRSDGVYEDESDPSRGGVRFD